MKEEAIHVTGCIREVLPASMFRIELPNGHVVLGHVSAKLVKRAESLAVGDHVPLELTPFDLSKARILFPTA